MNSDDDRISSLYHEADKPAPQKALDDTILAAARDAVETPARARGPFAGGWPAFTSIAAVILMTIVLVPILKQERTPQAPSRSDRPTDIQLETSEEPAPGAYTPAELQNKATGALAPVRAPATTEQDSLLYEQEALPLTQGIGSNVEPEPERLQDLRRAKEKASTLPGETIRERSSMEAADSAPFAIHTPEMWEVKITRLISEGKLDQARDELRRLKQHYPDYSINHSILEQLN